MRTYDEIVQKCHDSDSCFGFDLQVLVPYLPFEYAKEFLKDNTVEEEWNKKVIPLTEEHIKAEMADYMEFAWEKVKDHRGISASRSIEKMVEWCWLLGDNDSVDFASDDKNYAMYGAPILCYISKKYDLPIPWNGDLKRMVKGDPCHEKCHGCTVDVSTQEERMKYHEDVCIPLGKILTERGAQFKPFKTLGFPYSEGENKGIVIRCNICGVEVYTEHRHGITIKVYLCKWLEKPKFSFWKNRAKLEKLLIYGGFNETS